MTDLKKQIELEKQKIVGLALYHDILKLSEFNEYIGKYFDEYGNDSFINYLSMLVSSQKMDGFLTLCNPLIKDKAKIEKRFGVKILTPGDIENDN